MAIKKKSATPETKKTNARFKFVLSLDKDQVVHLPWSHIRSKLQQLFKNQLPGLKPIVDEEVPKSSPSVDYTVIVKDDTK